MRSFSASGSAKKRGQYAAAAATSLRLRPARGGMTSTPTPRCADLRGGVERRLVSPRRTREHRSASSGAAPHARRRSHVSRATGSDGPKDTMQRVRLAMGKEGPQEWRGGRGRGGVSEQQFQYDILGVSHPSNRYYTSSLVCPCTIYSRFAPSEHCILWGLRFSINRSPILGASHLFSVGALNARAQLGSCT